MNADREASPVHLEPPGARRPGDAAPESRLDAARSLELLRRAGVGRVVYTVGALPAVLPVRFRLDPLGGVLLSTAPGSELARAVDGAVIAFEADEVDGADGTGWCVTLLGRAEVRRPSPAPGARAEIRIAPELVVGRRLAPDTV
ncbi:pyridoxamine 5'-phosphate oxidase family protein [Kitasatospora purpeofusca]|uniref:pyridoxamine 5'-phosphate oxidase family protein n=1 Tax=Kitasatospora purpeofusca TaxID=67352 RepID=UPI002A5A0427|nr:pyridoxamine 5'-phosphate oxidase family protein [Kitasatospora purpeofusca]MDY0813901.1 pyridoxamine 5'-phosphate oxidase family protein [Kitasatospora purpeofusca]